MFKNVIAIVRLTDLEQIEKSLRQAGVSGISITRVLAHSPHRKRVQGAQ